MTIREKHGPVRLLRFHAGQQSFDQRAHRDAPGRPVSAKNRPEPGVAPLEAVQVCLKTGSSGR